LGPFERGRQSAEEVQTSYVAEAPRRTAPDQAAYTVSPAVPQPLAAIEPAAASQGKLGHPGPGTSADPPTESNPGRDSPESAGFLRGRLLA
jgi:hypothetical protein